MKNHPDYIKAVAVINALIFHDVPHDEILTYVIHHFDEDVATIAFKEIVTDYMNGEQKMNCQLCNTPDKKLVKRWYAYDNGEHFKMYVCTKCSIVHQKMLDLEKTVKTHA